VLGEEIQASATSLLDASAYDGETVHSATVAADVSFASEADRSAFMEEYLAALGPLLKKYGAREGSPYRAVFAVYPTPDED
jgi:hypothetical protein